MNARHRTWRDAFSVAFAASQVTGYKHEVYSDGVAVWRVSRVVPA